MGHMTKRHSNQSEAVPSFRKFEYRLIQSTSHIMKLSVPPKKTAWKHTVRLWRPMWWASGSLKLPIPWRCWRNEISDYFPPLKRSDQSPATNNTSQQGTLSSHSQCDWDLSPSTKQIICSSEKRMTFTCPIHSNPDQHISRSKPITDRVRTFPKLRIDF